MLEYGSPALPEFYSRLLLFGQTESKIVNHRRLAPFQYQRPSTPIASPPIHVALPTSDFVAV